MLSNAEKNQGLDFEVSITDVSRGYSWVGPLLKAED